MSLALVLALVSQLGDNGEQAGVVTLEGISEGVSITEGGAFSYNVSLSIRPSSVVWVAPRVFIKEGKYSTRVWEKLRVEPSVLTFKPEDWIGNVPPSKTFQLIAPEDYVAEQTQRFYVEHAIASAARP